MNEFKIIKETINDLEYQETEGLLTDKGIAYLKELKQALQLQQTGVSGSVFQSLEELKRNEHLISDLQKDENGNDIRIVDGKKIIQIEEKTEEDRRLNNAINLWRMRKI